MINPIRTKCERDDLDLLKGRLANQSNKKYGYKRLSSQELIFTILTFFVVHG